jgi:hypothetical protein
MKHRDNIAWAIKAILAHAGGPLTPEAEIEVERLYVGVDKLIDSLPCVRGFLDSPMPKEHSLHEQLWSRRPPWRQG